MCLKSKEDMTIRETIENKTRGSIYDRHLLGNKYSYYVQMSGRRGNYTDLHLETNDGETTIWGTGWNNEKVMLSRPSFINPEEEYNPRTGIWIGGYEYLYIKK